MARKRNAGVLDTLSRRGEAAVKATVRRASGARSGASAPDLSKALHGLVKALPIGDLDKRLAQLEKSVSRLEDEIRKAVGRAATTVRGATGGAKKTTRKKAATRKKTATRKKAAARKP